MHGDPIMVQNALNFEDICNECMLFMKCGIVCSIIICIECVDLDPRKRTDFSGDCVSTFALAENMHAFQYLQFSEI